MVKLKSWIVTGIVGAVLCVFGSMLRGEAIYFEV